MSDGVLRSGSAQGHRPSIARSDISRSSSPQFLDDSSTVKGEDDFGFGPEDEGYESGYEASAPSTLDIGRLNLVSWKEGISSTDEPSKPYQSRPFSSISAVIAHPTIAPAPLRGSKFPLPKANPPTAPPKAPPPAFYEPYLESLSKVSENQLGDQTGIWQAFLEAGKGLVKVENERIEDDEVLRIPGEEPGQVSSGQSRKKDLPTLDDIPALFSSKDFDLADPAIWDQVMELAGQESNAEDAEMALQDILSQHLETVESHLMHEVTLRAPMFFSALSNLQSLTSQTSSCLDRIHGLKEDLTALDEGTATKGLKIVELQKELQSEREAAWALEKVQNAVDTLDLTKELSEHGDWIGTLDGLEELGRWWEIHSDMPKQVPEPPVASSSRAPSPSPSSTLGQITEADEEEDGDAESKPSDYAKSRHIPDIALASLPALQSIPLDAQTIAFTLRGQIEAVIQEQLSSAVQSAIEHENDATNGSDETVSDSISSSIGPTFTALSKCGGEPNSVLQMWRAQCLRIIREAMRIHLQFDGVIAEDEGDGSIETKSQNLGEALRSMSHDTFLELSIRMYSTMLVRVQIVRQINQAIRLSIQARKPPPPGMLVLLQLDTSEDQERRRQETETQLQETLVSTCELANARSAKVLAARAGVHAELGLKEFSALLNQARDFIVQTEVIAGQMISPLRATITTQARTFLSTFHGTRLQLSAKHVEEELWSQVDVPSSTQDEVNKIVLSATTDPAGFDYQAAEDDPTSTTASKSLRIENQTFFVVSATAKTLDMLCDYIRLLINLDLVATDVMTKIIEFLKSFNSRTCQVVLGAGAMRSAGLKNITAKHLALASQSLSVVISLIPYIREFVRRHLNPKQAVMLVEFDKLKRDYQEHQFEVHAKLVTIMADRLAIHLSALQAVDWEVKSDREVNGYVELLVKEATTLHKVLSKYLAAQTVHMIMLQVVEAIRQRLGPEYEKVEFKSEEAKKRMLADIVYLTKGVQTLTGTDLPSPVEDLESLINAKQTPKKPSNVGTSINGFLRRNKPSVTDIPQISTQGGLAPPTTHTADDVEPFDVSFESSAPGSPAPPEPASLELERQEVGEDSLREIPLDTMNGTSASDPTITKETVVQSAVEPTTASASVIPPPLQRQESSTQRSTNGTTEPKQASTIVEATLEKDERDYFTVMGVERNATEDDIRKAYRKLMLQMHPDKQGLAARLSATFQSSAQANADLHRLNEAYRTLSDPESRQIYLDQLENTQKKKGYQLVDKSNIPMREISLDEFEYHEPGLASRPDWIAADDPYFTHPCRCSTELVISESQLEAGTDLIECSGCGERIAVGYKAVDLDEELEEVAEEGPL